MAWLIINLPVPTYSMFALCRLVK